jgi:acyl carrier protein
MDRQDIAQRVRGALAKGLGVDISEVTPEARFEDDLDADSLDLVEAALAVEEDLGVKVEDEEMRDIHTVSDVVNLVAAKLDVTV